MTQAVFSTVAAAILTAAVIAACTAGQPPTPAGQPMGGMSVTTGGVSVPPVKGYAEGEEILFIHTEASDPKVAKLLTDMMGSPVLVVPSLARGSEPMLANVFVFTNGTKGGGPMGFQSDVFDRPPGEPGYTPLRALNLVTWREERAVRELKSAAEVRTAELKGELTIARPGVVINMPFVTWPGGHR